jgi:hypothetical protein
MLSLKSDVNVPTVRNKPKTLLKHHTVFVGILKATAKIAGSGSESRVCIPGSVSNVTNPEH